MDGVELGRGVHAGHVCDQLGAAGVHLGELREVVGLASGDQTPLAAGVSGDTPRTL